MKHFGKSEILDALIETPAAKAVIADMAKRVAEERRKNAADLEALHDRAGAAFRANQTEEEGAIRACNAADAALKAAGARLAALRIKRMGFSNEIQRERDRLEAALIGSADPAIDIFVADMWREWELALKTPPRIIEDTIKNPNTGQVVRTTRSEGITPPEKLAAIRAAITAAEEMKIEPDQSAVPRRLEQLRRSIPKVGDAKNGDQG